MTHPPIDLPRADRKYRSMMQRRADRDLAPHSHRLELVGRLGALAWPALCANCGVETDERITVRKVFARPRQRTRGTSTYRRHVIARADVPYCPACIARHRELTPPRSLLGDLWRMLWPVLIPMAGSAWFFLLTLRLALTEHDRSGRALLFVWGLPAIFGSIFLWCVVIGWWSSRTARVERQSEVTRACDFSDDVSWPWERERRIYALRDERFAKAFGDANATRFWTTDDDRRSSRTLNVILAGAAVGGGIVWLYIVLGPR